MLDFTESVFPILDAYSLREIRHRQVGEPTRPFSVTCEADT